MLLTLLLASALAASPDGETGLPLRLQDEVDAPGHDFIDFGKFEAGLWAGIVGSSGDFESDPQFGAGLMLRAPLPWLSRYVLDMETDDLGLFISAAFTSLDRELDPEPENPDGSVVMLAIGLDYTFIRSDGWLLMAQAGLQYLSFGDIFETENGFGFFGGLTAGVEIFSGFWLTLNPQIWLGGGDYFFALGAGLLVSF